VLSTITKSVEIQRAVTLVNYIFLCTISTSADSYHDNMSDITSKFRTFVIYIYICM
jgi:hypothetical protein